MGKGIAWSAFALSSILFAAALVGVLMESQHRRMIRPLEADLAERVPVVAFDASAPDDGDDRSSRQSDDDVTRPPPPTPEFAAAAAASSR
jgi:hypothetical protein